MMKARNVRLLVETRRNPVVDMKKAMMIVFGLADIIAFCKLRTNFVSSLELVIMGTV